MIKMRKKINLISDAELKQRLSELKKEVDLLHKTGIPRCFVLDCHKPYIKESEYSWKPTCKHNSKLRISIG